MKASIGNQVVLWGGTGGTFFILVGDPTVLNRVVSLLFGGGGGREDF